ncbi:hypothetical protein BCR39DRAFT_571435, partial [Naematelia encephala]
KETTTSSTHEPPSSDKETTSSTEINGTSQNFVPACGVGEWEPIWLGRADYLENGVERDWSFRDVVLRDGEVIEDNGDHGPHPPQDEIPAGLSPGMERFLRRGIPQANVFVPEIQTLKNKGRM